jgi:hypothetical protein
MAAQDSEQHGGLSSQLFAQAKEVNSYASCQHNGGVKV